MAGGRLGAALLATLAAGLLLACPAGPAAPDGGGGDAGADAGDGGGPHPDCPPASPASAELRIVAQGAVRGERIDGVLRWLGVPYAAPPTGARRFLPPAEPACFEGVYEATTWPPPCAQYDDASEAAEGEEDCLYLNVWAPEGADGTTPVLVFVHGGGNMFGSTSEIVGGVRLYDGEELARRSGAVVVTLQYRLNIFGFAVDAALDPLFPEGLSGNLGLRDQLAALAWVQENIAAFGGAPDKVLLFGESGGASDVCALVASPAAAGLFRAAAAQSGGCGGRNREEQRAWTDQVFSAAGCPPGPDRRDCVQGLDAATLLSAMAGLPSSGPTGLRIPQAGPTIGDEIVPIAPVDAFQSGAVATVPFVLGSNADETASALFGIPKNLGAAEYENMVRSTFRTRASEVLAHYPVSAYATPHDALVQLTTDLQFTCPTRRYARALAEGGGTAYRNFYTKVLDQRPATAALGASHGIELYLLFQALDRAGYPATEADRTLESALRGYWVSLATHGDPNAGDAPVAWPRYDAASDPYLELGDPIAAGAGVRSEKCDFWDTFQ